MPASAPHPAPTNLYRLQTRPDSFTLSRGADLVLSFDLDGRPLTWFDRGTLYKRSLASVVHVRRREHGVRQRWTLGEEAADEQFHRLQHWLSEARAGGVDAGGETQAAGLLDRAAAWTPGRLAAEAQRFAAAYAPISILPPDQYYSVVVQLTRGCSWNRCTFCTFYRDRPFSVLAPHDLSGHLQAVKALFGESLPLRRSIFLADGNALMLSNHRLLPSLQVIGEVFPDRAVSGFVDVFTGRRKSLADWRALREAGVRRVYVGAETGHDPLLAWVDKPGSAEETVEFVALLKSAGLQVGVILMTGLGGERFAGAHLADTQALLRRLPLTTGDLVYLSPFVEHGPYRQRAAAEAVAPLPRSWVGGQEEALRQVVRETLPGVRVARYDIQEFIY